jgi:predicted transcriptional regulator
MARLQRDVTEAELAILRVLWETGPATVRQLIDRLYPSGGASAHATVQKLLERLEAKECISRDRGGTVQVISPSIGRQELIEQRIQSMADQLCDGSIASLLTQLIDARKVPSAQRQALRAYLSRLDEIDRTGGESKNR